MIARCGLSVVVLVLLVAISRPGAAEGVPGCPDLASLPSDLSNLDREELAKLKCFCSMVDSEAPEPPFSINCIFGSQLEDLIEALVAVELANRTVSKISLDHVEVSDMTEGLTLEEAFSSTSANFASLQELEIKDCRGGGLVARRETPMPASEFGDFPALETLTIRNCDLAEVPNFLLTRAPLLKSLSLPGNKISSLRAADFQTSANTLEYLDLTANVITEAEDDSIAACTGLQTLLIGEHNFAHPNLLRQIGSLTKLRILDMTRVDGFDSLAKMRFHESGGGGDLRQWLLTGCNVKAINASDFKGLGALEELDLRVNLLESIEPRSFKNLPNLKQLSLAGNFLNDSAISGELWEGLGRLEVLDLGWNELHSLTADTFSGLGESLDTLSLRHNEKLDNVEDGALGHLNHLRFLNLSGTALTGISLGTFAGLTNLEHLHLSGCRLSEITDSAFADQTETLKTLSLSHNRLRTLNATSTLATLRALQDVSLSANPWLCDDNIWNVVTWAQTTYRSAAESSRHFFVHEANVTLCDRPYNLQNVSIFDLSLSDIPLLYEESMDTTTEPLPESTGPPLDDVENVTSINFEDLFQVIGSQVNETLEAFEDSKKPRYDINAVRFGQKPSGDTPTNSTFATVAVTLLVIVTVIGILLVVRRSKNTPSNAEKSANSITTAV